MKTLLKTTAASAVVISMATASFAGSYAEPVVEVQPEVFTESSSSASPWAIAAAVGGAALLIALVSDDDDAAATTPAN